MHAFLTELSDWYIRSLQSGGYPLVVLLMAMESSIIPIPSEMVIPPAAHLAYTQGRMSLAGVVIAGALGCWIGATVMYWVSRLAGRPLVIKYGRYFFIPQAKVEAAEQWSARYGSFGIFASRMLPVVRHLIGIPAGIVRMDFLKFSIFTVLGSTIWCAVLAAVGVFAGQDEKLMNGDVRAVTIWTIGAIAILGTIYYFFVHRQMRKPA